MRGNTLSLTWCLILLSTAIIQAQWLRFEEPYIEGFHPLDAEPPAVSPLNYPKPRILTLSTTMFSDTAQIDFEKRQITFRRMDPLGFTMWEFHYGELSDYLASRKNYSLYTSWKKELGPLQATNEAEKRKDMKLEWELPMQYPSWAQRVLGKEPPKLKIDGFIEILMGYQNTQYDQGIDIKKYEDNNEFKFDINYSFGLTGSIGRLINVNIRADKEQDLDISDNLKNMKIEYKEITPGELEDEIIQEAIIGYTGFNMPGTNLSGYSESKEGLFGIKVRARLGPLELTSIVSTEQGQSNKKTYTSGSGGSTGAQSRDAKDFLADRYFFLDNTYRKAYIKKYAPRSSGYKNPPKVKVLSVWRNYSGIYTENISNIKKVHLDTTAQYYKFERLERDVHYYLNDVEGYIRLADSISLRTEQQLAIYFRTEDSTLQRGEINLANGDDTVNGIMTNDTIFTLWELRPKEPIDSLEQDPERYNLMWRNVYGPADYGDKTSFKLAIKRVDEDLAEKIDMFEENGAFYADTMGLSEKNVPKIQSSYIYNTLFGDLIIPPFDTSDIALEPFNNPAFGKYRDSIIYKYGATHPKRTTDYKTIWTIEMSGKKKKTTFDDLGWDIMENTELVKADGVRLERDRDYTISYSDGVIDLTSARAKAAEKIEIEYQSGALFVPERKMFLGTHGKIELPFISDKSYAGASILFQSTSSNDDIPRLDQEPFSKMLFDINTHIEFQPEWMTNLVKKIPLVQTDAPSSVSLDMELAHSRVNPNKSGSAYIDDFEDCKETDALGNDATAWYRASPPVSRDSLYFYPPAWEFYWFTPIISDELNRIRRNDIIELTDAEKKASQIGSDDETVLRLHAIPAPSAAYIDRYKKTWAGIMKPISQSFADKRLMQYFELYVKAEGKFEGKGKLLIQMGNMREDLSLDGREPNQLENREDTAQIVRTESYNKALDLGGDNLPDSQEVYWVPKEEAGQWEPLYYGDKRLGEDSLDPARDNYREYNREDDNYKNYKYTCRTQNDGSIGFSEDINYDGVVQTTTIEKYFQFTIDLNDSNSIFIDKTAKVNPNGGWRKYVIPLKELLPGMDSSLYRPINSPSWSNITMVRLIWTDFDENAMTKEQSLVFNNLAFVGNKWIEVADSGVSKIKPSVVNTKEDSLYEPMLDKYDNLINRERDQFGYEIEQSLRLNFRNLARGDIALVRKTFEYQTLNLSAYRTLSLLVYGQHPDATTNNSRNDDLLYNGQVKFLFRFGTDDSTYYEYRTPIKAQWNNQININLKEISDLKDRFLVEHRDSAIEISDGTLRIKAPSGRQPNFSRIRWMALGVIRDSSASGADSLSGEIWVNEMKLKGIRNLIGSASRVELMTKWADLFSFQAKMEYENGNFRRMTETQNLPDNTKVDGSMGASIALDKFLPPSLGISIPAGVSFNTSLTRPQLKNETDVYLVDKNGNPDNFFTSATDAAKYMFGIKQQGEPTRSEEYQTLSLGNTYYTSYKKSNRSENPVISLLSDRWSADAKYSRTISEVRYGKNFTGGFYAKSDTSHTYSGRVQYDLTPNDPPDWTKWSPFKTVQQKWLPSQMKNYELTFLPRKFTIDVADISYGEQRQKDTWRRVSSTQHNYTVRHNTALEYSPLSPVCDMSYTLGINRDLISVAREDARTMGKTIFRRNEQWKKYMVLQGEKDRTQHLSINFDPRFFDWLTTSSSYSSDYSATTVTWLSNPELYLNTGVKSSFSLNGSFNIDVLLGQLKTATEKSVFGGFFDMAQKGLAQIGMRDVSCSYTTNSDLKNNYVSTRLLKSQSISGIGDILLYQMGIKGRSFWDIITGAMDDHTFLGLQSRQDFDSANTEFYTNDCRIVDRSLRFSTNLEFKPLDLRFRQMSLNYSINYNLHPDTTRNDTTITFPDVSIGVSTGILNRIALVKQNLQSIDLQSTCSYRKSDRKTSQVGGSTQSMKLDFMPLLAFSGSLKKWPIRFDYRHNYSTETNIAFTSTEEPPDTNKNVTMHTDEFSLNYEFEKGSSLSEIKLLTWSIPVKGRTSIGLKFNRSSEVERVTDRNNKSYSLVPNLSYIFTDNVTGRAEYKFEQTDNGGEKTTTNDFSCTVQIRF